MVREPNEEEDLRLVKELIFAPHELELQKFTRAELLTGRTPDFRVILKGSLVAFCEVKSPRDDWLDNQLDQAQPGQIVGGVRADPVFNRIARHIEKAVTQFEAVNNRRLYPNILVFVNHDDASGYADLIETLTGVFQASTGERYITVPHISEDRIGAAKQKIDLYVWLNMKTKQIQGYAFNEENPIHVTTICDLLGLDMAQIKH
jgi:hypothetical protein